MMTHKEIEDYILTFPDAWIDFPFGEGTSVYKVGHGGDENGKMFAIIADNTKPLRVSLKCDPLLSEKLRETYETVLPGYHLNKKNWNTVLITGQVPDDELRSLVTISYNLASNKKPEA